MRGDGYEIADISVSACDIVHYTAYAVTMGKGNIVAVYTELFYIAVEICLHKFRCGIVHLFAVAVYQLYAVVIVWIVRGCYHYAAVKFICAGNIGNARRRCHMQHIRVSTRGCNSRGYGVFECVAGAARILAYEYARAVIRHMKARERGRVIPAEKAPYFICLVGGERNIGFAAETVGAEIFVFCACFIYGGFFTCHIAEERNIIAQERICRHAEKLAEREYIVYLRERLIYLPFRYRLSGDRKLLCELLLRNMSGGTQICYFFAYCHHFPSL